MLCTIASVKLKRKNTVICCCLGCLVRRIWSEYVYFKKRGGRQKKGALKNGARRLIPLRTSLGIFCRRKIMAILKFKNSNEECNGDFYGNENYIIITKPIGTKNGKFLFKNKNKIRKQIKKKIIFWYPLNAWCKMIMHHFVIVC